MFTLDAGGRLVEKRRASPVDPQERKEIRRWRLFVTSLIVLLVAGVVSAILSSWSYATAAERDPARAAAMQECFQAHSRLMDKPAVTNVRVCWRTHGYRMERR